MSDDRNAWKAAVIVSDEMIVRAAKALFAEGYVENPRKQEIVEAHWRQVSPGVRDAFCARATKVLAAALNQKGQDA